MRNFTDDNLTAAVLQQLEATRDERLRDIMACLIAHVHAFVREVRLTEHEWLEGIRFLTATGQISNDARQEFILLSDTLGVSMLVDAINHRGAAHGTESTVLGPFYREGAPERRLGESIAGDTPGEPTFVSGRVTDLNGAPIAGALLDVWHAAPNGLYETQDPAQPEFNLRGRFRTDATGRYAFQTVKPVSYPVPVDGPVGRLLGAMGRGAKRPAHIHVMVSARNHESVTTHLFAAGDPHLDSDPVFGVKNSLIVAFLRHDSAEEARQRDVTPPFYTLEYDFRLTPTQP